VAAAALTAAAAHADDASDGPGTVVTINGHRDAYKTDNSDSLKATAPLLDTPQTVQVITDQLMREQGATNLTEALRASPGIGTFYLGENGTTSTGDAVFLRGSDVSNSIFVDGVRDVASVSRDVFNIEQVEVLKGAAGTDVGRGSATGAVSLSTKHAKPAEFAVGSAGVGGGDYSRFTVDSNMRLGKSAALRVNILAQNAGVNGRDLVRNKRWGLATSLGFGLNDKTRYFFDLMHVSQDNIPDGGVSTVGLPGYTTPSPGTRDFLTTAARPSPNNFYGTKDDHDRIETNVVTFTLTHDFSDTLRLNNITRWS
jgi:catecholate siderophore receptor